ncbi:MAG: HPr family phosphocarrier protein, partial [Tannerellaceae bacterium]|nr:HPr family phosphocarrier protein [Tannerellaceae bacterium]
MVGFVLVSHSRALAEATQKLIHAMSGEEVPVAIAAGAGQDHEELGTDAVEISGAITPLSANEGIVVMMDMGSAVLSTEMALDFLEEDIRKKVRLCPWSFVEGSVIGGVVARTGGNMEDVIREASLSLNQKTEHLSGGLPEKPEAGNTISNEKDLSVTLVVRIPHGLHARPASQLVRLASGFHSNIQIQDLTTHKGPVSVKSITGVMTLEVLYGHEVEIVASGDDASEALEKIKQAFEEGLGDTLVSEQDITGNKDISIQQPEEDETKPMGVSGGIVIAPLYFPAQFSYSFPEEQVEDIEKENERLDTA